jgi:hypothetical protein
MNGSVGALDSPGVWGDTGCSGKGSRCGEGEPTLGVTCRAVSLPRQGSGAEQGAKKAGPGPAGSETMESTEETMEMLPSWAGAKRTAARRAITPTWMLAALG